MPDSRWYPPLADVKQRVIAAICMLYRRDWDLLDVGANERSLTHKLAECLQREFPNWHVDCEYNRHGVDTKKLLRIGFGEIDADDLEAKTVFPDIIVHQRRTEQNLLVLEVKKNNGQEDTDVNKLKAFTTVPEYQYQYGLFLRLGATGATTLELYQQGSRQDDWTGDLMQALQELGYGE